MVYKYVLSEPGVNRRQANFEWQVDRWGYLASLSTWQQAETFDKEK
jgi:hypothetical protein